VASWMLGGSGETPELFIRVSSTRAVIKGCGHRCHQALDALEDDARGRAGLLAVGAATVSVAWAP